MIETVRRRCAAVATQIKEPAQARPAVAWAFGQEARARLHAAASPTLSAGLEKALQA